MGSFSFTCTISGLPIEAGDPVRFFMLTQNPHHKPGHWTSSSLNLWAPRSLPIKAEYNHYGSIENHNDTPIRNLWLEGFKLDLKELGWGDNKCHDVPVHKGMIFDELCTALYEKAKPMERSLGPVLESHGSSTGYVLRKLVASGKISLEDVEEVLNGA